MAPHTGRRCLRLGISADAASSKLAYVPQEICLVCLCNMADHAPCVPAYSSCLQAAVPMCSQLPMAVPTAAGPAARLLPCLLWRLHTLVSVLVFYFFRTLFHT